MADIKNWAITICAVSVLSAVLNMLIPDGKYEKVLRLCIAAFAICACLGTLGGAVSCDVLKDIKSISVESENRELEKRIESQMNSTVQTAVYEIMISMDNNKDGSISIGHITVVLINEPAVRCTEIKIMLKESLGLDITVEAR